MRKFILLMVLAAVGFQALAATVQNVRAKQLSGTKQVEVYYDLIAAEGGTFDVSVQFTAPEFAAQPTSLSGAVGSGITPGRNKRIVWNAGKDWPNKVSRDFVCTVTAEASTLQSSSVRIGGKYLVIDLSAGPNASRYPVTTLNVDGTGVWTDEYKTNKLVLRRIEAGTFIMGERATDRPGGVDYGLHQVTLSKPFYIGVFEVTQRQWELVTGTRPSYFKNESCYAARPVENLSYDIIRGSSLGACWPSSSAVDKTSFLGRLRSRTDLSFDLPTEAQWEYACRAGTTTALNNGKNLTVNGTVQDGIHIGDVNMDEVARYFFNSMKCELDDMTYLPESTCDASEGTAIVGSYKPNAWGLYDMHGNVYELCLNWHDWKEWTDAIPVTDPKGPFVGSARVARGGNWAWHGTYCKSGARASINPSVVGGSIWASGLRLCCSAGQ